MNLEQSKAANLADHEKQILNRMAADASRTCAFWNIVIAAVICFAGYIMYCVFQASPLAR